MAGSLREEREGYTGGKKGGENNRSEKETGKFLKRGGGWNLLQICGQNDGKCKERVRSREKRRSPLCTWRGGQVLDQSTTDTGKNYRLTPGAGKRGKRQATPVFLRQKKTSGHRGNQTWTPREIGNVIIGSTRDRSEEVTRTKSTSNKASNLGGKKLYQRRQIHTGRKGGKEVNHVCFLAKQQKVYVKEGSRRSGGGMDAGGRLEWGEICMCGG